MWYARATGKIPATPEVAATVVGKLVERNWTPEAREVWSALASRLKNASGLPLDEGKADSPNASSGTEPEAPAGGSAPPGASIWFPLP